MHLARTIARRSLVRHPGRTLFSILGVAVGIATVVAVFTLDHVTVLSRTRELDPNWGADLEVRPASDLSDPRAELLALEGVAGVAAFFQNDVRFRPVAGDDRDEGRVARVRLVGLEAGSGPSLGVYHVNRGDDLSAGTAATGVLIGGALANDFGLSVGDAVYLSQPPRAARQACIEGQLQELDSPRAPPTEELFRVTGILAAEGIGRKAKGRMVVVDYDAGRRVLKDVFFEAQYWVRRNQGVDIEALETNLASSFTFEHNETKAVGQMADERAFRNGVRMAGLFALLLGLFVIFHTLSMSLVERVKEVGALHALGATRLQIARIFFTEACVIATAAGALGILGGLGLTWALLRRGITTLGVADHPLPLTEVPWDTVLILVGLGVGIALVGSVYPILRARATDVVAALRGDQLGRRSASRSFHVFSLLLLVVVVPVAFFRVVPIVGAAETTLIGTLLLGLVVLGLLIGLPLMAPGIFGTGAARLARPAERWLPLVGKLAANSLERNPNRIGASVAAVALVTSAFVGLKGMTSSLAGEIEVWGETAVADKVWVERLPDLELDEVRAALHVYPGVLGVESGDARAFPSFLLLGLEADEIASYGPLAEDPQLAERMRAEQVIVISERLGRQRDLTDGDTLLIQTSGHGVQEFEIIAVSDDYGYFLHPDERAYGVVDSRHLERFFCVDVDTTSMIAVRMNRGDLNLVATALHERFPELRRARFYDEKSVMRIHLDDLRRDFVLFDIILLLTALLAALGVLNGQLLAALERKKELGILRALGTTRGQIAGAVLFESALIGAGGGLLGLAVGTGLTPVLVAALRVLSGLPLPLRTAGAFLPVAFTGAVVLTLLAGLYPIWRMNRMSAVEAVRAG